MRYMQFALRTTFDSVHMIKSIVLCLVLAASTLVAGVHRGFHVTVNSAKSITFTYESDATQLLGPGLREHRSSDGSHRQIIASADIIVPSQTGYQLRAASSNAPQTMALSLPAILDAALREQAYPSTQQNTIEVRYLGVSGDRHIARISLVVAEQRGTSPLMVYTNHTATIDFVGAVQAGRPTSTMLSVLNPKAPWWISDDTPRLNKQADNVQGLEALTNVFALRIQEEGFYRISRDQLRGAGVPTDAGAARTLKIFGRGGMELPEAVDSARVNTLREQPIVVRTEADGSIREVLFYASGLTGWSNTTKGIRHYINHFSTRANYYLSYGGADGFRAQVRPASGAEPDVRPTSTTGRVFQEEELVHPYNSGSGRRWYGRSVENKGSITVTTMLPGFVQTGDVFYRYVVGHRGNSAGYFTISENATAVGQKAIDAVPDYMDAFTVSGDGTVPAARLGADGRSVLKFAYNSSDNGSTGIIDWFEIHYPRSLNAHDGSYEFWSTSSDGVQEYSINGFSGEVFGVDATDRSRPVWIENTSVTGGMFVVRELQATSSPRRYMLSSVLRSTDISRVSFPNLRLNPRGADVIIITHPALRESAEAFAAYRSGKGRLSTSVVTTDEIFAEFSYGMLDPTAIRDFLAMAYASWQPRLRYAVLWGDGHFDYKNISSSAPNYVIPYESFDPDNEAYGLTTYTTDDFYARIIRNDSQVDLAIGRVPISSNAQGRTYIEKLRRYEDESSADDWRTRITLIADDSQAAEKTDGVLHLNQSEDLANRYVPREFQAKKIYLVEYPTESVARGRRKPAVTQEMLSTINTTGSVLLNWIGHGNPRVWAHEEIFRRETTPNDMLNANKAFFLTAATCDFARYDMTETQSGAEELLLKSEGGAIGVFSAARVVYSTANAALNEEFYTHLFEREEDGQFPSVGTAMFRVKQRFNSNNDEKFHLLGDPTLQLLVPNNRIRFTSINGSDILSDSSRVTVPALGTVVVEGDIIGAGDSAVITDFNGNITVSLLDARRTITIQDNDINKTMATFTKPGPALYRGSFVVENGRFTATFVVPKDISFSASPAGLYGYAASSTKQYAMGVTDRIVVDGVTSIGDPETDGPAMQVFMDSRKFLPGGLVRMNPVLIVDLEDATGINTTGIGIGHDITATFDDDVEPVILTPTFTTSLSNSKAGTAQKQIFGLGPGLHTVKVRAWDVLNNVSETTTTFRIEEQQEGIRAEGLFNFPNPFSSRTTIRYTHASQRPFTATLMIFDLTGRMLVERQMQVSDMQTADVVWDGNDDRGDMAMSGIYQVVVRLQDHTGATSYVNGKLTLIR